jgi:membrane protease YdiL (CAAX protease family)
MRLTWRAFGPWAAFIVSAAVFGGGHMAAIEQSTEIRRYLPLHISRLVQDIPSSILDRPQTRQQAAAALLGRMGVPGHLLVS